MIERHAHSRIEYMVKAKSQFKRRSTANNVEIIIPVPNDADGPKFKTTIGKHYLNVASNILCAKSRVFYFFKRIKCAVFNRSL